MGNAVGVLLIILLFAGLFYWAYADRRQKRAMREAAAAYDRMLRTAGIDIIDRMSGQEFEARLASLFEHLGYDVAHLGGSGDYGADFLIRSADDVVTAVQAKCYSRPVGVKAFQEALAAKDYYDADKHDYVDSSCEVKMESNA